jgi:hypothetical protein
MSEQKSRMEKEKLEDKRMSMFVNTKPVELMGEIEKIRVQEIKTKKARDDKINLKTHFERQGKKRSETVQGKIDGRSMVPFYERMQTKERELKAEEREKELKNIDIA